MTRKIPRNGYRSVVTKYIYIFLIPTRRVINERLFLKIFRTGIMMNIIITYISQHFFRSYYNQVVI